MSGDIGPSADVQVKLGDLITDPDGRLIVLGGHGVAGSWKASPQPPEDVHNPDWFDDTSDGPVQATISRLGGLRPKASLVGVLDWPS